MSNSNEPGGDDSQGENFARVNMSKNVYLEPFDGQMYFPVIWAQ